LAADGGAQESRPFAAAQADKLVVSFFNTSNQGLKHTNPA